MYSEDDLLPISALQHLLFCERQTALIHIERLWEDNRFTAEGNVLHQKADAAKSETREGTRITRSLPVHSFKLGLFGICDIVQFTPPDFETESGLSLPKRIQAELSKTKPNGSSFAHWTVLPVEYKRGKPKANDCDRVQICAQAMSLEEMLHIEIRRGHLFYGKQQRRTEVDFDERLRSTTIETADRLQKLIRSQQTPRAVREKKCDSCSLLPVCMPPSTQQQSASSYLKSMINQ